MHKKIVLFFIFTFSTLLSPFTDYEKIQYKMEGAAIISSLIINTSTNLFLNWFATTIAEKNVKYLQPLVIEKISNSTFSLNEKRELAEIYKSFSKAIPNFIPIGTEVTLKRCGVKPYIHKNLQKALLLLFRENLNESLANEQLLFAENYNDFTTACSGDEFELPDNAVEEFYRRAKKLNNLISRYNTIFYKELNKQQQEDAILFMKSYFIENKLLPPDFIQLPSWHIGALISWLICAAINKIKTNKNPTGLGLLLPAKQLLHITTNLYGVDIMQYRKELAKAYLKCPSLLLFPILIATIVTDFFIFQLEQY